MRELNWRKRLPYIVGVLWLVGCIVVGFKYHISSRSPVAFDTYLLVVVGGNFVVRSLLETLLKPGEKKLIRMAAITAWVAVCAVVYDVLHVAGEFGAVYVGFVGVSFGGLVAVEYLFKGCLKPKHE